MTAPGATLGVVIPTLDEAERLPLILGDLENLPVAHRTVVVDGGSTDGTRERARDLGVRVVEAPRGRAIQLNAGARALDTPWLLFLHADVRLPRRAGETLAAWLDEADPDRAAHFRFRLEGDDWFWRLIELGQAVRERLAGLVYGDQGLVVSRAAFERVGGYPETPLMEDVEIIRRLLRAGRVERLEADLLTSPRRYEREGRWAAWLRNGALITLYLAGADPGRLARWYPPARDSRRPPGRDARAEGPKRRPQGSGRPEAPSGGPAEGGRDRVLLVFAKAPVPGEVKTRLADGIGDEAAARLYRVLGRRVVDQVRDGEYRTVLCFAPREREGEVREWLGEAGLEFRPQAEGDLGHRMARAFEEAFRRADRACIVGTDAPGVDRATVETAFRALDDADVVLGPARDGGYYLLALRAPAPGLFRDVPWSTGRVLEVTRKRARKRGLRVHLLPVRADVDTPDDVDPGLLAELKEPGAA